MFFSPKHSASHCGASGDPRTQPRSSILWQKTPSCGGEAKPRPCRGGFRQPPRRVTGPQSRPVARLFCRCGACLRPSTCATSAAGGTNGDETKHGTRRRPPRGRAAGRGRAERRAAPRRHPRGVQVRPKSLRCHTPGRAITALVDVDSVATPCTHPAVRSVRELREAVRCAIAACEAAPADRGPAVERIELLCIDEVPDSAVPTHRSPAFCDCHCARPYEDAPTRATFDAT